ncbi:TPA: RecB-like helicase [Campylobacter jejuni]|uniref:DNA 3'-5' helicase n=1 Tax=Campylobacter jejuni TaxID=197 RepID=A0A5T1QRI8_CAMJU|nr:RecB-like helicase [Campylobacter jejuni]AXL44168.1 recombinase RecB [Campylobacter jejuni]EAH4888330.1 RecB-like helicase [Campylobacter jejuni]EAI1780749.1 RecB-like helicase [Campylobacter jejuni]EAK4028379.1 RecB-like helicase [Campylobacter jejuni]EAK4168303.1 RecB-like helicase [Campylobacter jejuni]
MSQFEPFLALEASAGSGKTFALSVRFVALILKGARINEILALTFTKKAANEMQKRIIETFLNLEKENKTSECNELCKLLGKDKEELISLRDAKKEEFLRTELKISTFDAFFGKILRVFALNLGLSSDFTMSEERLDVREIFLKLLKKDELKDLAYYINLVDEKENFFNELEKFYENAYFQNRPKIPNPSKAYINKAYSELRSYCLGLTHVKNYKNLCDNFKSEVLDLSVFMQSSFMTKFESTKYLQDLESTNLHFSAKRMELINALNTYAIELENYKIANLMNLLNHYSEAKNIFHKDKNTLNFQDVSKKVYELITSEFKDMIYFRLDGFISHLLIDEFQDTSVIQYQILRPLIAELVSGEGVKKNRTFFYVGDKKQSIYRFRKGKKELFDLLKQEFSQIKSDSLNTNYRSKELLVDFVNETFKEKIKDYKEQFALESKKGGFVRIVESKEQKVKNQAQEIKEKTLETLFEQINFLRSKNISYDDICILCWKNSDADMVLDFLREQKIPAFTQSNVLLENKASVRLVLEYAKYCIFGDEFYLVFLKELLGFEPRKIALDFSKNAMENVLFLIKELKLDLNDIALIQFIEYAKTKENFLKLLFEPCTLKIVSEQNMGISIMSVHKSKGLEFDHVILLDSLSKNNSNNEDIMLEYDINQGWQLHIKDKIRELTKEPIYTLFKENITRANYEDDINKLYVAFTRAKESLIIIKRNEESVNGNYPSYFKGGFLNIHSQERGFLESKEQILSVKKESIQTLQKFEKISLQEVQSEERLDSKELYFGNAFHFFMQNLKLPKGENFQILTQRCKSKFRHFLDESDFEKLFKRIEILLKNIQFQNLVGDGKLLKEQALSFNGEIKQLDLLALKDEEAFIIDYKTGLAMQDKHKEQVRTYKIAISEILKKDKVHAFIVYCLENEIQILEI